MGEVLSTTGGLVNRPFGLPEAVPVLADAAVMERSLIALGGGRDTKLRVTPREFENVPGLRMVPELARTAVPLVALDRSEP